MSVDRRWYMGVGMRCEKVCWGLYGCGCVLMGVSGQMFTNVGVFVVV